MHLAGLSNAAAGPVFKQPERGLVPECGPVNLTVAAPGVLAVCWRCRGRSPARTSVRITEACRH